MAPLTLAFLQILYNLVVALAFFACAVVVVFAILLLVWGLIKVVIPPTDDN